VMDYAFGDGSPFSVGIEEELLLVDPETRRLAPDAEGVLARIEAPAGLAAPEAYAAEIELRSRPAASAADAAAELLELRAAAARAGATLLGVGVHPAAELGDAVLVDAERYRVVGERMRGLMRRTPECALHVHVGMPDAEAAIRAFNGLRGWLPLLAGLAAGSPFWFGTDSGMASSRAALVRTYPGRGIPPALRDLDAYEQALADVAAGGGPDDYTLLWWDVRMHPRLGTVELREMDTQPRLIDAAALAALVQGLARHEAEGGDDPAPAAAIEWSSFAAARDGLDARILHRGGLVGLREAAADALELAAPHARELGSHAALEGVQRILREGGSAARQRAQHRNRGVDGLLELLLEETAAPL
jgi:carboxylate-amine ligase